MPVVPLIMQEIIITLGITIPKMIENTTKAKANTAAIRTIPMITIIEAIMSIIITLIIHQIIELSQRLGTCQW